MHLIPPGALMSSRHAALVMLVSSLVCSPVRAQSSTHAFTNARILPIAGTPIDKGTLVVRDGKIVAVGPPGSVRVPRGAERHDLAGKVVMPGLVDTHSHIGGVSGGDGSAPVQPEVRVLDSVDVRSSGLRRAQAGGI